MTKFPSDPMIARFFVPGVPAPQGSKKHVGNGVMVENNASRLRPWRDSVAWTARETGAEFLAGPVAVQLVFWFPRPKAHYRAGNPAGPLKENAPSFKASKPDVDKITRAVLDGISSSGLWTDDAQVAECRALKRYAASPADVGVAVVVWGLS